MWRHSNHTRNHVERLEPASTRGSPLDLIERHLIQGAPRVLSVIPPIRFSFGAVERRPLPRLCLAQPPISTFSLLVSAVPSRPLRGAILGL